jgi:class 3 adenylate cyclase
MTRDQRALEQFLNNLEGEVVGQKKFYYDVWGDMVNVGSRMESHGVPGKVQVTQATYELVKDDFVFEYRGKVDVKGKGEMETWFVVGVNGMN